MRHLGNSIFVHVGYKIGADLLSITDEQIEIFERCLPEIVGLLRRFY